MTSSTKLDFHKNKIHQFFVQNDIEANCKISVSYGISCSLAVIHDMVCTISNNVLGVNITLIYMAIVCMLAAILQVVYCHTHM